MIHPNSCRASVLTNMSAGSTVGAARAEATQTGAMNAIADTVTAALATHSSLYRLYDSWRVGARIYTNPANPIPAIKHHEQKNSEIHHHS